MIEGVIYRANGHTWAIVYHEDRVREVLLRLGRWASDPAMPFTWRDAAIVACRINQRCKAKS